MRTVKELISLTSDYFREKGIPTPRLDAEVLLSHCLDLDRVGLYCCLDRPVNETELSAYREMVRRRQNREPVAYITGVKEFYGIDFTVKPKLLIPRPDTETVVETALDWITLKNPQAIFCDVGTGTGSIAISILVNAPASTAVGTDFDDVAVETAKENARNNDVGDRFSVVSCDLLNDVEGPFDLILSNPPYIPVGNRDSLEPEITAYENPDALFAGEDGLDVIKRLLPQAMDKLATNGALMIEIGKGQHEAVTNLIESLGVFDSVKLIKDLAGVYRVVSATGYNGAVNG